MTTIIVVIDLEDEPTLSGSFASPYTDPTHETGLTADGNALLRTWVEQSLGGWLRLVVRDRRDLTQAGTR